MWDYIISKVIQIKRMHELYTIRRIYIAIFQGWLGKPQKKDKFWSGPTTKREGSRGTTKQI